MADDNPTLMDAPSDNGASVSDEELKQQRQRFAVTFSPLNARFDAERCCLILEELDSLYYEHDRFNPALTRSKSDSKLASRFTVFTDRSRSQEAGEIEIAVTPAGCEIDFSTRAIKLDAEQAKAVAAVKWNLYNLLSKHQALVEDKYSQQYRELFFFHSKKQEDSSAIAPLEALSADALRKPIRPRELMEYFEWPDDCWLSVKVIAPYDDSLPGMISLFTQAGRDHRRDLVIKPESPINLQGTPVSHWRVGIGESGLTPCGDIYAHTAGGDEMYLTFHTWDVARGGFNFLLPMVEEAELTGHVVDHSPSGRDLWDKWKARKSHWDFPPPFVSENGYWAAFDQTLSEEAVKDDTPPEQQGKRVVTARAGGQRMADVVRQVIREHGYMVGRTELVVSADSERHEIQFLCPAPGKDRPIYHGAVHLLLASREPTRTRIVFTARDLEYLPPVIPLIDRITAHYNSVLRDASFDLQAYRQKGAPPVERKRGVGGRRKADHNEEIWQYIRSGMPFPDAWRAYCNKHQMNRYDSKAMEAAESAVRRRESKTKKPAK